MEIHFVYAGCYYWAYKSQLRSFILKGMKKYKIGKVMLTIIHGWRHLLITKESMENYCNGKEDQKQSVNDDLETFSEDIRLGKELNEFIVTYFLPKLTSEELDLVERKDNDFMQTFTIGMNANQEFERMLTDSRLTNNHGHSPTLKIQDQRMALAIHQKSKTDSKFVKGYCWRETCTIKNSWSEKPLDALLENQSHKKTQSSEHKIFNCCSLQ